MIHFWVVLPSRVLVKTVLRVAFATDMFCESSLQTKTKIAPEILLRHQKETHVIIPKTTNML